MGRFTCVFCGREIDRIYGGLPEEQHAPGCSAVSPAKFADAQRQAIDALGRVLRIAQPWRTVQGARDSAEFCIDEYLTRLREDE